MGRLFSEQIFRPSGWIRRVSLLVALGAAGCDWEHYALMNSIPVHGDPARNPVVRVYLGVDGVAHSVVSGLIESGRIDAAGFTLARHISAFPAASDHSWTRLTRAPNMKGYEYCHYAPEDDEVKNQGLGGILLHAVPHFQSSPFDESFYHHAFDYHGNGYLDVINRYGTPEVSFYETLDSLFTLLDERMETSDAFFGYVMETDPIGHMEDAGKVAELFTVLWARIEGFKRRHPERRILFTLLSDHGMDFIPAELDQMIRLDEELPKVGVRPVESLAEGRAAGGLYAIPVLHTLMSYAAVHTEKALAEPIAEASSRLAAIDLAVCRVAPPGDLDPAGAFSWFALYRGGRRLARFGHDPVGDLYHLPRDGDYGAVDLALVFAPGQDELVLGDEALFAISAARTYPDLFYRVRTSLSQVGVEAPAEVLLSFARPYISKGLVLPGDLQTMADGSFHGDLTARSSDGILLSEEIALPAAVRGDTFLDLFPALVAHLQTRGIPLLPPEQNASLDYAVLP